MLPRPKKEITEIKEFQFQKQNNKENITTVLPRPKKEITEIKEFLFKKQNKKKPSVLPWPKNMGIFISPEKPGLFLRFVKE